MKKTDKIIVAGHRGLVGSALRQLQAKGYDVRKLNELGYKAYTHLNDGMVKAYADYLGRNKESL